jgi:hypothetical protein
VGIYNLDDGLMRYSVDGSGRSVQGFHRLSPLDLRIIASLKNDARRTTSDIARAVGISTKTARRHLQRMIAEGSVAFDTPVDMERGGDLLLIMHVNLRNGSDKVRVGKRLLSKAMFRDQYVRTYSNVPGTLHWIFWSDKMPVIREAVEEASRDTDVRSVILNFAYIERLYPTWRDKLLGPSGGVQDSGRLAVPSP